MNETHKTQSQIDAEDFRNASKEAAKDTADLARQGDTDAARDILRDIVEAVELSSEHAWTAPIPWHHALYIAEAFRKILNDDDADAARALGLKANKAGRPPGATNEKPLAAAYWLLVRRGRKPEDANRIVSAAGADRRTIQRAARTYAALKNQELFDDQILLAIIRERPSLTRILDAELTLPSPLRQKLP